APYGARPRPEGRRSLKPAAHTNLPGRHRYRLLESGAKGRGAERLRLTTLQPTTLAFAGSREPRLHSQTSVDVSTHAIGTAIYRPIHAQSACTVSQAVHSREEPPPRPGSS